ncbi:TonB-dependent receptor domain-containing protein [Sphingomonas radiodurans]|uniref:TonB-dependent receptor domain-containing protein n=1 Tax=Sphingomonas radiodurans TaxID=2890321 RepID=UPI001E57147F|nr:TonB-dependent receptor [Sphingomonas radiodurans]WBH15399.1 TonB-dependent receptor [Sphingomonas radiodurans]
MRINYRSRLLTTTLLVGAAMASTSAFAQSVDSTTTPGAPAPGVVTQEGAVTEETSTGDIVVTGTLIKNPNLVQATPVKVVGADEIDLQQANVAEELLREIPGITPSIGSAVNNGNGGASFVNLRNLGSNRNVVLLDGVRLVPAELNGRFDLNNVPLALIERVDVLTGGASTTYGADAVSGVVNFITRRDFSGIELNLSEQISEQGDGNVFRADLTVGANFDDGRGNAVLSIGYQEADPLYQGSRDYGRFGLSSASGGGGGSGTAVPSRFSLPGQGTRQVNAAGTAFNPTTAFTAFNFNPYNVYQTPFERYNMYGAANYEVSDAVEVYSRGIFSKNTVETIIAPSGAFGIPVQIPLNNPFLTASLRNSFCGANGIDEATCLAASNPALTPGQAGYRTVTSNLSRRATEVGPRISEYTTTFFDYRAGARGGITESIDWDMFGSYGESENLQVIQGYTLNSRVRDSFLANSTTACFDGTAAGCVPVNWFGAENNASFTPAALDFLSENSTVRTKTTMAQMRGTVSGDFGVASPFASNPISFAVGGEYRKYTASQESDTLAAGGDLGGAGGAAPNIAGGYNVYEAIGEIIVPLVSDKPFFQDLTIEGGIRYSKYDIDAAGDPGFNTTTWKAAGSWTPVDGFKVRGNYARAVRAPNIAELFSPVNTGLTNLSDDPCATFNDAGVRINPNPTGELRAICLAQGASASNVDSISQPTAGQAAQTGGGNINLQPETSTSWTAGVVFTPTFAPRLSISADYYNIKINGAITQPTPGDAISACFGANPRSPAAGASQTEACTIIRRDPLDGDLAGDPNTTPGLFLSLSNLGKLETSGVDVTVNYSHDLGFTKLSLAAAGNWTEKSKFQAVSGGYDRDCVGYFSANCGQPIPEWQWSVRGTLTFEAVDVSLLWRHLSGVEYEGLADDFDLRGFAANARTLFTGALPASAGSLAGRQVDFNRISGKDYFDLTVRANVGENYTFTFGVQNLLDQEPPLVGGEAGSTTFNSGNTFPSTYDAIGRRFVAGAKVRF